MMIHWWRYTRTLRSTRRRARHRRAHATANGLRGVRVGVAVGAREVIRLARHPPSEVALREERPDPEHHEQVGEADDGRQRLEGPEHRAANELDAVEQWRQRRDELKRLGHVR